jgi:hypothetical protein
MQPTHWSHLRYITHACAWSPSTSLSYVLSRHSRMVGRYSKINNLCLVRTSLTPFNFYTTLYNFTYQSISNNLPHTLLPCQDGNIHTIYIQYGHAMAQAVSRRPPTAEARVRSRVNPCGICGGQSGTGTGFSPSSSVFPLSISFHWCSITRKRTTIIIIFITGLHEKPQGCSASVASAALHHLKKIYIHYLLDTRIKLVSVF